MTISSPVSGSRAAAMEASMPGPLFQMLAQESHRARPGVLRRLEVGARAVVLGAQETVAGAVVDMGLVGLPELLHLGLGRADGGDHPRVVAAVEAPHGGLDAGSVRGLGPGAGVAPQLVRRRLGQR